MATETSILNIALRRVGHAQVADMDTSAIKAGVSAQDLFDHCRDDLVRQHWWNFAMHFKALSTITPDDTSGWDYSYGVPTDLLRIKGVKGYDDPRAPDIPYAYESVDVSSTATLAIRNNWSTTYLLYARQVTNVNLMPIDFQDLLAMRLALELAQALKRPKSTIEGIGNEYKMKLASAKSIDGQENYPDHWHEGSWVTSRYINGGGWGSSWV